MDVLYVNGLRPGFELMGSPSGIFTDMENKTQVYWWRSFVGQAAARYISM
jgi:L-iduronidase